jgi:Recombination endonuclease VII.
MTSDAYDMLLLSQEGKCKICARPEPVSGRRLAVDHDHQTGEVRGLLCTKCNTTVGWVEMHPNLNAYLKGTIN